LGEHHHHHLEHRPRTEAVVLELGAGIGALVVQTDAEWLHDEIEISPADDDADRSHKDVLERRANGRSYHVAVFDGLTDGRYTIWHHGVAHARDVRVAGGAVAELDLRG
jgi:hypothetical protein